jgi:hypothetical protein
MRWWDEGEQRRRKGSAEVPRARRTWAERRRGWDGGWWRSRREGHRSREERWPGQREVMLQQQEAEMSGEERGVHCC